MCIWCILALNTKRASRQKSFSNGQLKFWLLRKCDECPGKHDINIVNSAMPSNWLRLHMDFFKMCSSWRNLTAILPSNRNKQMEGIKRVISMIFSFSTFKEYFSGSRNVSMFENIYNSCEIYYSPYITIALSLHNRCRFLLFAWKRSLKSSSRHFLHESYLNSIYFKALRWAVTNGLCFLQRIFNSFEILRQSRKTNFDIYY